MRVPRTGKLPPAFSFPGALTLFGLRLSIFLTETFAKLPQTSTRVHMASTCGIAVVVELLMAPATCRRISYGGNNTDGFGRLGSAVIIAGGLALQ